MKHPTKKFQQKNGIQDTEFCGQPALVSSLMGGGIEILLDNQTHRAIASASLAVRLAIGDIVGVEMENNTWRIQSIAPRKNELKRLRGESNSRHARKEHIIAANIDTAIIVAPVAHPDFDAALTDRYIAICRASNIEPVLCLHKCDLTDARDESLEWYTRMDIRIIETSLRSGAGLDALRHALIGKTAVFVGKSGAGKSSLIKYMMPDVAIETQDFDERTGQGRHTTTRSTIYRWERDSYVIDTPGVRMLDVSHLSYDEALAAFPEIEERIHLCAYRDCQHDTEPDCAIKNALTHGDISPTRWQHFLDLLG